MKKNYDFVIVGAGIVGLSTAYELTKRHPKARIAILEKEPALGLHASGRNSGVLHSGIYYSKDTLKAKVCVSGSVKMREFAREHAIPCRASGKVIVAASDPDVTALDRLQKNARDNGIRAERLNGSAVRKIEPFANPDFGGLYCQDTAVIDPVAVLRTLHELLLAKGVSIFFNQKVTKADASGKAIHTSAGDLFAYDFLFNCAGAYADVVAKFFGQGLSYTLVPFKGIYYKLHPSKKDWVNSNIYPVPDLLLPFLGVHFTRVISGDVYVGPTAIPGLGRENYSLLHGLNVAESATIFWQLVSMYARNQQNFRHLVHVEMKKYLKPYFVSAAQRLIPDISSSDLLPCPKVGIRPQLINSKNKTLEMDYILEKTPHSLHVLNAISPAFTGSFAFAELIVDEARL